MPIAPAITLSGKQKKGHNLMVRRHYLLINTADLFDQVTSLKGT